MYGARHAVGFDQMCLIKALTSKKYEKSNDIIYDRCAQGVSRTNAYPAGERWRTAKSSEMKNGIKKRSGSPYL